MLKRLINSVRRNHALEHATISILLTRLGPMRIVGRAVSDGFYIYGDVSADRLREFADEALSRLQRGEAHLAVSPLCGTNIAVAGVLAGLVLVVSPGRSLRQCSRCSPRNRWGDWYRSTTPLHLTWTVSKLCRLCRWGSAFSAYTKSAPPRRPQ
jgi:Domain of unknown function (DUF6391)